MKRWALRMNKSLASFEDPVELNDSQDLVKYFQNFELVDSRVSASAVPVEGGNPQ